MIVITRGNAFRMFFAIRGSVIPKIASRLLLCTGLAVLVTVAHGTIYHWQVMLTPVPFSLIGLALAIFLGFRNNAAFDRYWEGRKLWGSLLHHARTLARQVQTLTALPQPARYDDRSDPRTAMILRTIGFAHALRHQLRETDPRPELARWLGADELAGFLQPGAGTSTLLRQTSHDLGRLLRAGQVESNIAAEIDATLTGLSADAAGCERIRNTPLPFAYSLLLQRTALLYCFLLPFGLVESIGAMTPLVVLIVAYTFFGLDALGHEIEEPFGTDCNHLPLDALCRTLEINLLRALDAPEVPEPLAAVDGVLL